MIADNFIDCKNAAELFLKISDQYKIDRPYIVGGRVRDFLLGLKEDESDIDITTNSSECIRLGVLFSLSSNQIFRMFDDRHIRVFYFGKNIDFSPGVLSFAHPGVREWVTENHPDKLDFIESFSRDFTINSMHQDFESGEVFDPTGMGIDDINAKIIRCSIAPEISIKNDPRRIFRAIKFASKFGFTIDSSIVSFVKENPDILLDEKLTTQYITIEINEALKSNQDLAIANINDLGVFKAIPLSGLYSEFLIKNKLLSKYLS